MELPDYHWTYTLGSTLFFLFDLLLRAGLSLRVIMSKKNYGVSYAWLIVILLIPLLGSAFYLLFGENRLSDRRVKKMKGARKHYQHWLKHLKKQTPVDWTTMEPELEYLHTHALNLVGIPAMPGNHLELLTEPDNILASIATDIENSQSTCHLQFYIWQQGGNVDKIEAALIAAAKRGVTCRVLLDALGSHGFFKSPSATRMRAAGIKIQASLPAGIIKAFFYRIDIRNHRKIVVIDGKIAYTGSQNMVDPNFFKQTAGVGNWVDTMARIQGPIVETLAGTFANDWYLEADIDTYQLFDDTNNRKNIRTVGDIHPCEQVGDSAIQLLPSGPGFSQDAIHSFLLDAIYTARYELTLTTPYFIPDESLLLALKAAALRGVKVTLIIPKNNDSKLVRYASRAKYHDLTRAGVKIMLFTGGLLHSKTITIDNTLSLFGSVNLDMRSFWINFEATLVIYCPVLTKQLIEIQQQYIDNSETLDIVHFHQRRLFEKFKENCALLVSPLL